MLPAARLKRNNRPSLPVIPRILVVLPPRERPAACFLHGRSRLTLLASRPHPLHCLRSVPDAERAVTRMHAAWPPPYFIAIHRGSWQATGAMLSLAEIVPFQKMQPDGVVLLQLDRRTRDTVPIKGGLLLEHFARLAANVTGAPMAVISVLGRRSDGGPTSAAFGISVDQLSIINEFDRILRPDPVLAVVPDMTRDPRFADMRDSACAHPNLRFLCHLKLLPWAGEPIGFICILDKTSRPGLTEAQATSLSLIAGMVLADRRREQRHLHLMHVANRALRVDRMLRLVSEAASCADALTSLLEELCRFHGSVVGRIWQLTGPDSPMLVISRYDGDGRPEHRTRPIEPAVAINVMAAEAIRRNEPRVVRFSRSEPVEQFDEAMALGLASQVCIPMWVQQQRFGISLAFATEHAELDAVAADITSLADTIRPALLRKVTEERIRFVAHHDDLTQLSNRLMFQERLSQALAATQNSGHGFGLLCLDLDGFKSVNDTRGHEAGDQLLIAVAQRLRNNVRDGDTVARMGGDEFAIIQQLGGQPSEAITLAQRLLAAISKPFELEGRRSVIGVSIGIALYPQDGDTPDLLLRNADTALYQAKAAGRNTFRLFNNVMQVHQQERILIEQELREAIEGKHFTLHYQPLCDSKSLRIVGFEALLRWRHDAHGLIQPDQFIPLAELSGLIIPLGRWALEAACLEAAEWDPPVCLSVNLSPLQFRQPDLPQQIADVLMRTGLPAERLDLEVTEGLLLDESDLVLRTMRTLHEQGIRITLDDFGTAYASLSYLRRFPFDRIKIDRSFIRGIGGDDTTQAIVQAILSLGDRLDLTVVAEGVETERELDVLRALGCRLVQGYLPGRPIAGRHVRALLRRSTYADGPQGLVTASAVRQPCEGG
jgi:diguanylate cyclase (GGDEF)-like protein